MAQKCVVRGKLLEISERPYDAFTDSDGNRKEAGVSYTAWLLDERFNKTPIRLKAGEIDLWKEFEMGPDSADVEIECFINGDRIRLSAAALAAV